MNSRRARNLLVVKLRTPTGKWLKMAVHPLATLREICTKYDGHNAVFEFDYADPLFICGSDLVADELIAFGNLNVLMIHQFVKILESAKPEVFDQPPPARVAQPMNPNEEVAAPGKKCFPCQG